MEANLAENQISSLYVTFNSLVVFRENFTNNPYNQNPYNDPPLAKRQLNNLGNYV